LKNKGWPGLRWVEFEWVQRRGGGVKGVKSKERRHRKKKQRGIPKKADCPTSWMPQNSTRSEEIPSLTLKANGQRRREAKNSPG